MRFALLSLVLVTFCMSAQAQHARVKRYTAPKAGTVNLKDAPDDKYNAHVYHQAPDPDGDAEQVKLNKAKQESAQRFPHKSSKKKESGLRTEAAPPPPTVVVGYRMDTLPGIPPDNHMALSVKHQGISVVNSQISEFNGSTGAVSYYKSLYNFSYAVGLYNSFSFSNNYRYDPKVIYDSAADRYICVMLNGVNQYSWIVVGFSQTDNPGGAWAFYKFRGDFLGDSTWFDYPCLAITRDELFITGNKIYDNESWQTGFKESVIYQIRKQDGYNGDTAINYQIWDSVQYGGNFIRNIYPLNNGASIKGPDEYFVSIRNLAIQNDSVFLIEIPDTIGSADSTLTVKALVSPVSYGLPPNGREPDTPTVLQTNDGRVLGGYRENNEIDFVSTSIDTANGASGIYIGQIMNYSTSPTVTGQIFSIDTLDFGYPNLSYTGNISGLNSSIISFNYTGPHTNPGAGAIYFDGTSYSSMLVVRQGDTSIVVNPFGGIDSFQRWGDYSGSQPDWGNVGLVWVENIYGSHRNANYGNYIAELKSPYFTGVPQVAKTTAPTDLYPNPASQFIRCSFDMETDGQVSFFIYDMQGKAVDKVLSQACEKGKNLLQFNVAPLPVGDYVFKAIGSDGRVIATNTFVRR
jgi:Secretion system C-terminal sorting domain